VKLKASETDLVGKWITVYGRVRGDHVCERIEWLTAQHLRKIAVSKNWGGWETLFQDPDDGRYWERTYQQSELHGGGPPRLTMLLAMEARRKYRIT